MLSASRPSNGTSMRRNPNAVKTDLCVMVFVMDARTTDHRGCVVDRGSHGHLHLRPQTAEVALTPEIA